MPERDDGVRVASVDDVVFLGANGRHVRGGTLADLVATGRILLAEEEGSAVGWLRWGLFWDEVPFMNMLFVLEPFRGRGWGDRLVKAWEAGLRADGHDYALTSTQSDEDAQHFYRKRGWVDCGALLLPGEPTEIVLRKDLTTTEPVVASP